MALEQTQVQGDDERQRATRLSLGGKGPPASIPGYEPEGPMGSGAYGEVWLMRHVNSRRPVAVKFYHHRGALDGTLLAREVETLSFLFSDRYVVQLLAVGWDADPPYYIMEYLERGSLAESLSSGPLPANSAIGLFRDIAVGLLHAHARGILHCDLKPANILLDQDGHPRLADFGQSRLSHDQTPAMGTMFYMPPEQADLEAVPDVRWDVYALGAIFYHMLVGRPPYREGAAASAVSEAPTLAEGLARYRRLIAASPRPTAHRRVPGVDRALADVIERCLAPLPRRRYPNVQSILDALKARADRRARRPLWLLGGLGPALVVTVAGWVDWLSISETVRVSTRDVVGDARLSDRFAAELLASRVAARVDDRWRLMEAVADDPELGDRLRAASGQPTGSREHVRLQAAIDAVRQRHPELPTNAWAVYDRGGIMVARSPYDPALVGADFSFRDYFHGLGHDLPRVTRNSPGPVRVPHRSIVFRNAATKMRRRVAFSVPIWQGGQRGPADRPMGVLLTSVNVEDFAEFARMAESDKTLVPVVVDRRGDEQGRAGMILFHPALTARPGSAEAPPMYVSPVPAAPWNPVYRDPVAALDPAYSGRWLAASHNVIVERRGEPPRDTGWTVVVQDAYDSTVGPVLALKHDLMNRLVWGLALVATVLTALWLVVFRLIDEAPSKSWLARLGRTLARQGPADADATPTPGSAQSETPLES
jgi:hypothetical protein